MVVPLLARRGTIPGNRLNLWGELRTSSVVEGDSASLKVGKVAIAQEDDLVGVLKDGDGVGGEELLSFADTNDKRRFTTCSDDSTWLGAMHHHECPLPVQPRQNSGNREANVALVGIFNQVGDHLGVDVARKGVPLPCQLTLQFGVVLNDPVVNDGDLTVLIHVGMGVQVGWRTMGGPPRVGDPSDRAGWQFANDTFKIGEAARTLAHGDLAPRGRNGDSRGVIAAVLKEAQPLNQRR